MEREAPDFLVGEVVDISALRVAHIVFPESAVEPGEVEDVRVCAGDFDAGEGFVEGGVGGGVNFDGAAGGQVEFAYGGVVGGRVEVVGRGGAELEGADCAGMKFEAGDGGFRVGVGVVVVVAFGFEGCGGLGAVEYA